MDINKWIDEQVTDHAIIPQRIWIDEEVIEIARGAALEIINDRTTLINNLAGLCHNEAFNAGWWSDINTGEPLERNVGELMMLMVSEIAEGFEAHRTDAVSDKIPPFSGVTEELADALIRIFDFAGKYRLPIGQAFEAKIQYNRTRADHKRENRLKPGGKKF